MADDYQTGNDMDWSACSLIEITTNHLLGDNEEYHGNLSQDRRSLNRDLNSGLPRVRSRNANH